MREIIEMHTSKETVNKLRWVAEIEGVFFSLYIPKWRVPKPWPAQIIVTVDTNLPAPQILHNIRRDPLVPIIAIATKVAVHTQTVHYAPIGQNSNDWEIGEPYIPFSVLNAISPRGFPEKVRINVMWDYSGGKWIDENNEIQLSEWVSEQRNFAAKNEPISSSKFTDPYAKIYNRLIEAARKGDLVTYAEIARLAQINLEDPADRNSLAEILGKISTLEHHQGRPMLTAIVVSSEEHMPGNGFFDLARRLGVLHKTGKMSELEFFATETKKAFFYWSLQ